MNILSPKPILTCDVQTIGLEAAKRSPDGDVQLSILLMTLISMAKSLGIGRAYVLRALQAKWDDTPALFTKAGTH